MDMTETPGANRRGLFYGLARGLLQLLSLYCFAVCRPYDTRCFNWRVVGRRHDCIGSRDLRFEVGIGERRSVNGLVISAPLISRCGAEARLRW